MSSQLQPSLTGLSGMARRLVSEGVMSEDAVRKAMADSGQQKTTLGGWLLDHNLVDSAELTRIASAEFGMPTMDVTALNPTTMPLDLISEALISKHQALPLFRRGKRLYVGIADPMQSYALDEIKFHSNCMVEPILVERGALQRTIETLLNNMRNIMPDMGGGELDELDIEAGDDEGESSSGVDANANDDAPVVKFVNKILVDAIRRGASDIHFEPFESMYRVRLRMDGMLKAVANPPMKMANRISSRIKVMAQLDIAEKRVPQDGRIKLNLSKTRAIDFRVSTLRRGSGGDRRQESAGRALPPAAGYRRRRCAHRRPDHPWLQHRRARVGPVPEGLRADRLVSARQGAGRPALRDRSATDRTRTGAWPDRTRRH